MSMGKPVENSGPKTGKLALVPQPHGGAIKTGGNPGNKGGTGRPPNAWKSACARLVSRNAVLRKAKQILEDPDHPAWLGALKFLSEQAYGKPTENKTINKRHTVTIRVVSE